MTHKHFPKIRSTHFDLDRDKSLESFGGGLGLLLLAADLDDVGIVVSVSAIFLVLVPLGNLDLDVVLRADLLHLGASGAHHSAMVLLVDLAVDGNLVLQIADNLQDPGLGSIHAVLGSLQGDLKKLTFFNKIII